MELTKLRTGRAHPSLIDHVMVSYYGNQTPITQVSHVTVEDARTLVVAPWESSMIPVIEKAIRADNLGLNPIYYIEYDPLFKNLHNHEEFKEILNKQKQEFKTIRDEIFKLEAT